MTPVYKRILLKLSGEALLGDLPFGISPTAVDHLMEEIAVISRLGIEIAIVIGAGNLFRGVDLLPMGIHRVTADQIGMLGTVVNALAMRDVLERKSVSARIFSALPVGTLVEPYERHAAISALSQKQVVIFSGGTGNPLVTTDSAASLRGLEIEAEILLKGTHVDGIYSSDPKKDNDAKRFSHLSYQEVLKKELAVMDLSAFCQCRDYGLPIRVFNIHQPGILMKIICGDEEGTLVD